MSHPRNPGPASPAAYGSAKDLPSYRELATQIQGAKLLTLFVARDQRKKLIEIEQQVERLVKVVDAFYERLGARNWIFHDLLNVDKVELLLVETSDADAAEARLIELYRDHDATKWWLMRLLNHDGLRQRRHQIERALEHYEAGQFDSCTMHLIAVMDGFVNDYQPGHRKGLHSRDPDDMAAWDSVVGHHMGLTHAMATFTRTIKKRIDDEVFEVFRHGIVHGSVVNFNNAVVATKAWNMLFAVADWATATQKAAEPKESPPSWSETWATITRQAARKKYERDFVCSTVSAIEPSFASNEIVVLASDFLHAWELGRWGIVTRFTPPMLRGPTSEGEAARQAKGVFEQYVLKDWAIESIAYDMPSAAAIAAKASVNGQQTDLRFRMVFWSLEGNVAIPGRDDGTWSLAVWAPHTFFAPPAAG